MAKEHITGQQHPGRSLRGLINARLALQLHRHTLADLQIEDIVGQQPRHQQLGCLLRGQIDIRLARQLHWHIHADLHIKLGASWPTNTILDNSCHASLQDARFGMCPTTLLHLSA